MFFTVLDAISILVLVILARVKRKVGYNQKIKTVIPAMKISKQRCLDFPVPMVYFFLKRVRTSHSPYGCEVCLG